MNTNLVKTLVLGSLVVLVSCSVANADLGSCFVLRGTSSQIDGEFTQKASRAIYRAHEQSDDSASDVVFVLDIAKGASQGSYEIQTLKMILGDIWTLTGYRITASDPTGIMNGIDEVEKAFAGGRIYELKEGKRSGAVAKPQFRD